MQNSTLSSKQPSSGSTSPQTPNVAPHFNPANFPLLYGTSSEDLWKFVYSPSQRLSPEFVYTPLTSSRSETGMSDEEFFIHKWNCTWESYHLRPQLFKNHLPPQVAWLSRASQSNIYLLPDTPCKYEAYAPLYHLLPENALLSAGLPFFPICYWPFIPVFIDSSTHFPADFISRFSQSFAHHIWPLINKHSHFSAFSKNDPLIVLSHNLDFWLPYIYQVIENRLLTFPRCSTSDPQLLQDLDQRRAQIPAGLNTEVNLPHKDGVIWQGQDSAWQVTKELIEAADNQGRLRNLIDAVRSNRIQDDFSERWSFEREDFERKLYHKRNKVKVTFVELPDTLPVLGPTSECEEELVWQDFMSLLDKKERRVVVCLKKGITKVSEIGNALGYANHTPVSKALKRIRAKAARYLEN